ncbi:MAG TPA: polysaccharide deacetylase family protein [Clostridiaceae bacterium]
MKKVLFTICIVIVLFISTYFASKLLLDRYYIGTYKILNIVSDESGSSTAENLTSKGLTEGKYSFNYLIKHMDRPLYPKEIFMTIDDGPSYNTLKVLKILDQFSVKANFFVIGKSVEGNEELLKKMDSDGMCILSHSYSHDYKMYQSKTNFDEDFNKNAGILSKILGKDIPFFYRFPGGSDNQEGYDYKTHFDNMIDMRYDLKAKGYYYVDWNVSSGDAAPNGLPMETIKNNLINQSLGVNFIVSLMHDASGKETTAEALPFVIDSLKKRGYVFRTFNDITPTEIKEMERLRIINRAQKNDKG